MAWSDIDKDGKRIETTEKICFSHILKGWKYDEKSHEWVRDENIKEHETTVQQAYMDRLVKLSAQKLAILDRYLGVKKLLGENQKLLQRGK